MLSRQLAEALDDDGVSREFSDQEILDAAAEAAKRDPKKRFSTVSLKAILREREGGDPKYVVVIGVPLERRLRNMSELPIAQRKIVPDKARGFYKMIKATRGTGVEFNSTSKGSYDILLSGEYVGEIETMEGAFIGATRQRSKVYVVSLDVEGKDFTGHNAPPEFKALADAKKWVTTRLSR